MWGVVPSDRHDWAQLREDIQKCESAVTVVFTVSNKHEAVFFCI